MKRYVIIMPLLTDQKECDLLDKTEATDNFQGYQEV